ncbi:MAG: transposase domain-containing protein [Paracoccaceae bacterium]
MKLAVADIAGLPDVPTSVRGVRDWLKRLCIPVQVSGKRFVFNLTDLPPAVAQAASERLAAADGLDLGERDEDTHARLEEASPKMRAKAEHKARIARFLVSRERLGWTRAAMFEAARKEFGPDGTQDRTLFRVLKAVEGVDVANFAPALLDDYHVDGRPCGPSWDDAWHYALSLIKDAGAEWPLDACYDRLEAIAADMEWHLPSRSAFHARWQRLSEVEKFTLRQGEKAARDRFRQPVMRDRGTLMPNDCWSLDGRTLDDWTKQTSGAPFRPVELRLVDVATGYIVGKRLCQSENAVDTVALIIEAVRTYGIPKEIYTDNGRAFAAFIVSGRATFKFRRKKDRKAEFEPPGVCDQLRIHVRFAKPANGQAKIAERSFAETAKRIDEAPEFKGAHSGSRIDRKPEGKREPVEFATLQAVHDREIAYHNARKRRGGLAKGRSFAQLYHDGMAGQIKRVATERQLYLATLLYKPASVDRNGRVKVEGWTYGQPDTMLALLKFFDMRRNRAKETILVGIDPNDHSAPAIAYDRDGHLIAENIKPVIAGAYHSQDGKRDAQRFDKAARDMAKEAGELSRRASAAMIAKGNAAYAKNTPKGHTPAPSSVVKPRFNAPLNDRPAPQNTAADPNTYLDAMDRFLGMAKAGS